MAIFQSTAGQAREQTGEVAIPVFIEDKVCYA
jgi:hypothetical protein